MAELTKLTAATHGDLKVAPESVMELAGKQHVINLRVQEVTQAACSAPVFFSKNPENGDWALTMIASLTQGNNLFVDDGKWNGVFMPSIMQTYPIYLMQSDEDEKGYAAGIEEENPAFSKTEGQPLFDDNGQPSIYLSQVTQMLEASLGHDVATRQFTTKLDELSLLRPVEIQLQYTDDQTHSLTGLHTLDEDALKALPADTVKDLHERGYLAVMHAALISIFQINSLIRQHNLSGKFPPLKAAKVQVARDVAEATG